MDMHNFQSIFKLTASLNRTQIDLCIHVLASTLSRVLGVLISWILKLNITGPKSGIKISPRVQQKVRLSWMDMFYQCLSAQSRTASAKLIQRPSCSEGTSW